MYKRQLQYDAEKLKLDMGELSVTIEGNELVVDTYQKTLIPVREMCIRDSYLYCAEARGIYLL